jgi:hypothetical protein
VCSENVNLGHVSGSPFVEFFFFLEGGSLIPYYVWALLDSVGKGLEAEGRGR